jgi:tetratricopeptide (TPR) repeat protein
MISTMRRVERLQRKPVSPLATHFPPHIHQSPFAICCFQRIIDRNDGWGLMDDSGLTRWKGSQEYWEKLAQIYSGMFRDNPRSYIFVPLADALYNAGMASQAMDTLEMGLAILPNSRAGMVLLARLRKEAGDTGGAKALLLDVVCRWPDNTSAVTMLCGIYRGEGLFAEAKRIASVLLDYFPDAKRAQNLYGKYSALAENSMKPSPIRATAPAPALAEPELTPESEPDIELDLEPEPDVELTLAPEPAALAAQSEVGPLDEPLMGYDPAMEFAEASSVMTGPELVQPGDFETEPEQIPDEAPEEEKNETRSGEPVGQAVGQADNDRQLTLVKLESILMGISRRRK